MCDFKLGDEVLCIRSSSVVTEGRVYIIDGFTHPDSRGLLLAGVDNGCEFGTSHFWGHRSDRFRKVQRRDLSVWLETSVGNTDKLDKRQKKGVRA